MKKLSLLSFILISILCIATGCYNNTTLNTQSAINLLQNDMANIASTIRNLDSLYLEDYAINELNPMVNYNSYNNMNYSHNLNNNVVACVSATPYNGTYNLNYSYEPKYIDNVNSLDTSYLISYLQSIQDLFLITSDITAANQILNQLTYDIINDTINVRNNAYLLNYNLNELTEEQIAILQEYSATINNILVNIQNTSGYITNELNNLYELRSNFYKNTETLNAKYINVLNILENRIVQLQNIQMVLDRLNNQLILMSDVNNFRNNNFNNINNGTDIETDYNQIDNNAIEPNINNGENNVIDNNIANNNTINDNAINGNLNNNCINGECHECQVCDICGNCAECEICEVCPSCKNPSICDGNCNVQNNNLVNNNINTSNYPNNNANNLNNNLNNNNNLGNQNDIANNLNNGIYGVNNNYNTQNIDNNYTNCHECKLCEICNNCANCEACETCPQCNLPSTCLGNCKTTNLNNNNFINDNNINNIANNNTLNNEEMNNLTNDTTLPNTALPNGNNTLLNDNPTGYSNYNGESVNPILNGNENLNYQPYSIYNNASNI